VLSRTVSQQAAEWFVAAFDDEGVVGMVISLSMQCLFF